MKFLIELAWCLGMVTCIWLWSALWESDQTWWVKVGLGVFPLWGTIICCLKAYPDGLFGIGGRK